MSNEIFRERLAQYCAETFGAGGELTEVQRLSGGASMESWAFSFGGEDYVLRRLPRTVTACAESPSPLRLISSNWLVLPESLLRRFADA